MFTKLFSSFSNEGVDWYHILTTKRAHRILFCLQTFGSQWRSKALRGLGSTVTWEPHPFPSPTSSSLPFPPLSPSSPAQPLRPAAKRPQIQLGGLEEHCKLPQRGLGQSPSRNRIWCILALKSVIRWQQFKLKSAQRDAKPARWLLHIDAETILSI